MTLTKAAFFQAVKPKEPLKFEIPGFGDVWIKDVGEVQRSRRIASMFDGNGNRIRSMTDRRRLYEVIDQVCVDAKGTPLFTDADLEELTDDAKVSHSKLEPLYAAILAFNGDAEKNGEAGSPD